MMQSTEVPANQKTKKCHKFSHWLFFTLTGLVVFALLITLGGYLFLRRSLPQTSGTIQVAGLDGPVEITRDADGVPHIVATTDHDAYFAMGYVHAQDRLWQMEFRRRIGAGRLSEILGETTLDTDKFIRTIGPYRAAQSAWTALSSESQATLEAYAAGVNAWLDEDHPLPPEYLILGFEPEPWTVYDSLVWTKMMAWDLGGNYDKELLRLRLIQAIGPARTAELMPPFPDTGTTILAANQLSGTAVDTLLDLDSSLQVNLGLRGLDVGSNNWVISGELTETGLPLLANDPHLSARIPSIWYLAEIQGDTLHVTGATLPGLPTVVIGHNEDIAWGLTNLGPDVQDLYIERINPDNLNQYEVDGEWQDITIVEEPIYVQGKDEPILWAARSTRHGPLISDVSGRSPTPLALRWTALDPGDTTYDSFIQMNYASDWESFKAAAVHYVVPSQNLVFADKAGNIGYLGPGHIPIRAQGDGTLPVPGWDSRYEWQGWIPFDELPQSYNPEQGYIVTANNRVVGDDYPYHLTYDWSPRYRAERITEMIEALTSKGKLSVADMQTIQGDQLSAQGRELLPFLQSLTPTDDRQAEALAYLQGWDLNTSTETIAPSIYHAWLYHFGQTVFEDDLRGVLYDEMATRQHMTFLANIIADDNTIWCDNFLTTPTESCADTALVALDRALDDLTEREDETMANWQWGKFHRTQYPHNPFSEVDALKWLFHREIANGGDRYTVNVAHVDYKRPYLQYNVPSYRHIIDMSDFNNSLFMHTTGQSGHALSPHYDDLIERHQAVEYLPMFFGIEVDGQVLVLEPK